MALRSDSPTGMGGRGRSPKILSFSGKNHDGMSLRLARSGRSSLPLHAAGSSRPAAVGILCPVVFGAELEEMAAASIASGSPVRAFGSALATPCSDFWLRRVGAGRTGFAGFWAGGLGGAEDFNMWLVGEAR